MTQILITYLIVSQILMFAFLLINEKDIREGYLSFEDRRGDIPTSKWYGFYIFTHILKAPFLAPMILVLILLNGGKLVK
jgi:hypothetical protein